MPKKEDAILLLLKLGVTFAFIYPAIAAYLAPLNWIGYFPPFLLDVFGEENHEILLHLFGISEILIALWILIGKRIFIPSILASLYLLAIVLLNLAQLDVIFRDISILLMAVALALMSYQEKRDPSVH